MEAAPLATRARDGREAGQEAWPAVAVLGLVAAGGYALVEILWSALPRGSLPWQANATVMVLLVCLGGTVGAAALVLRRRPSHSTPLRVHGRVRGPGWQLLAALAVFPLAATVRAVEYLIRVGVLGGEPSPRVSEVVPDHPEWTALLWGLNDLGQIAAALGLVALLLRLSGEPGLGTLGMPDRSWPALDLRRSLSALVLLMALPQVIGNWLLTVVDLPRPGIIETGLPTVYVWPQLVGAIAAGLVEEVVVLGFLVHRASLQGWSTARVLAVGIVVRTGFHLYYGWGALPLMLWAGLALWAFLRWRPRRVAPFVLAHIAIDAYITLNKFDFPDLAYLLWIAFVLTAYTAWLATTDRFLWWRQARVLAPATEPHSWPLPALRAAAARFTPPPAAGEQLRVTALVAVPTDPTDPHLDRAQLLILRGRRKVPIWTLTWREAIENLKRAPGSFLRGLSRLPRHLVAVVQGLARLPGHLRTALRHRHQPREWMSQQSDWLTVGAAVGAAFQSAALPSATLLPRRVNPAEVRRLHSSAVQVLWTDARDGNETAQLWDRFDAGPPPSRARSGNPPDTVDTLTAA